MSLTSNIETWLAQRKAMLDSALADLAEQKEALLKQQSEGHWASDSGSARDALTVYSMGRGDYDHNFDAGHWRAAQTPGYASPVWGNPAANFAPHVESAEVEGEIGLVLTCFVPYADALEFGQSSGTPPHGRRGPARPRVIPNLIGSVFQTTVQDFLNTARSIF